jgi:hypothetical protein
MLNAVCVFVEIAFLFPFIIHTFIRLILAKTKNNKDCIAIIGRKIKGEVPERNKITEQDRMDDLN